MRLTGLRVTATLGSPLEVDYDIHLDALLEEASYRRMPHSHAATRRTPVGDLVDLDVPLARIRVGDEYVWASSSWRLSGDAERVQLQVVKRKDPEDIDRLTTAWAPNSGPGRNLLARSIGVCARSVSWTAYGSPREARKALSLFSSLGDRRRHGNGVVLGWTVEEVPDVTPLGCLVDADGRVQRHIPARWCARIEGEVIHAACRGPYWHPGRQQPTVRPGARVVLHDVVRRAAERPEIW